MLKEVRERSGMSQSKLAEVSGVKLHMIQFYEQGYRDIDGARLTTLVKLAKALNCSISDLLNDPDLIAECQEIEI